MLTRLFRYWVYGGALAGLLLLTLLPVLAYSWSQALTLVFLQLPLYMLHQYEEHDDDRFRRFFNQTIGRGREVLSSAAVFFINVPGVWGVISVAFYLAAKVNIGYGLIAVYLALVNAIVHIIHAFIFKCYNPGLVTAIALFLPSCAYSMWQIQLAGGGQQSAHAIGLGVALGIHAALIGYVKSKGAFGDSQELVVSPVQH